MRPTFRSLLPLVMLAMLLAPAEAGAAGPGGTITVTPATGLVDGQVVTVTGTGLPPGTELEIFQCRAGAVDESGCSGSVAFDLATDNVGGFTYTIQVDAFTFGWGVLASGQGGDEIDCRAGPEACFIGVGFLADAGESTKAPISFDPTAPLRPPVSATVEPSTNLRDGQVVRVEGKNLSNREQAFIFQCAKSEPPGQTCAFADDLRQVPDDQDSISLDVMVHEVVRDPDGSEADCTGAAGDCVMIVSWGFSFDPDRIAIVPLSFAADAPPQVTTTTTTVPPPPSDIPPSASDGVAPSSRDDVPSSLNAAATPVPLAPSFTG